MTPSLPISARTKCQNPDCGRALTYEQRVAFRLTCSRECAQALAQRAIEDARPLEIRPLRDRSTV